MRLELQIDLGKVVVGRREPRKNKVITVSHFPPLLPPGFDVLGERAVVAERGRLIRMCVFGHGARILNTLLDAVA